ncbi:MAG: ATP-binding protein [Planctomycetes bacterium]|nr:ATP-binding protein [Planctomycetota bacterium]
MTSQSIRARDRDAIIQSLRAGVVPKRGQQHIQVGRVREVEVLAKDLDRVADAGSSIRFVIGSYGSGKTFFLNLVRSIGLEKRLVAVHADLTPDRRLFSTGGHARALYAEMMRNMSTRSRPDGGALPAVVERFVSSSLTEARERGVDPTAILQERLASLSEMVGGYDFAQVVECYWRGHDSGDERLKGDAVRWMRAEFVTRTDARKALGVRTIIEDATVYDHLKLMGRFVRLAGFGGLLVCMDELVNLYKMASGKARNTNYEQILRILNDCLQGSAEGIGFILGGTPEFLTDTRRGLFSYQALQTRLSENSFSGNGMVDLAGPVIRLASLSPEDIYVLLMNIRNVFASGEKDQHLVPDQALRAFMEHCSKRVGEAYFRTPRNTIREFVHLLAILEQNPGHDWTDLIAHSNIEEEGDPDLAPLPEDAEDEHQAGPPAAGGATSQSDDDDDDLSSFRL